MHYHAYEYRGPGEVLVPYDDARRLGGQDFESSMLPPERTGAWLARPARQIQHTADEPAEALEWLAERYRDVADTLKSGISNLDVWLTTARESLESGNDVVWAFWADGGRYVHLAVICCPHRDVVVRCPVGRTDSRPEGATR